MDLRRIIGKPFFGKSLIQKLIGIFALVFLLFFVVVETVTQKLFERQIVDNTNKTIAVLAENEAIEIENYFKRLEGLGKQSAREITEWLSYEPADSEFERFDRKYKTIDGAIRTDLSALPGDDVSGVFLSNRSQLNDEIKQIVLATENRFDDYAKGVLNSVFSMYLITRHQLIRIYKKDWALEIEADHDFTKDIFYSIAAPEHNPKREPQWTAPYYDSIWKRWMISLIAPIYRDGRFFGVVGHDVVLDGVYQEILERKFFETGYGFLFDGDKNIIIHPHYLARLFQTASMGDRLRFTDLDGVQLTQSISNVVSSGGAESHQTIVRYEDGGKQYFLFSYKLNFLNWYYAIVIPYEEIVASLPLFQRNFVWYSVGISVVLFAIVVAILWIYVVSPIDKLTEATERIHRGDLERRVDIASLDEIGDLAVSFNEMADKLKTTLDDLRLDIVKREKVERELSESEIRYRGLVSNVPVGLYRTTLDSEGRFLTANMALARMCGCDSVDELCSYKLCDLYGNPEDRRDLLNTLFTHGKISGEEIRYRKKDGYLFWGSVTGKGVLDESGEIAFLDGMIEDITERKKFESALKDSESLYHSLVENLPQGIVRTDLNGVVTFANQHFFDLVGKKKQECVGSTPFDLFPKSVAEKLLRDDRAVMEIGGLLETTEEIQTETQRKRTYQILRTPVVDAQRRTVGVQAIFWDVTDKLRVEDELSRARKLESIGILAGGIAHDFNNLLTAILGNVSLLKMLSKSDEKKQRMLANAEEAAMRAQALTQQLLTFSRGGMPVKQTASISEILEDTTRFALRGSNVSSSFESPNDLWLVDVDCGQFCQAVQNIVLNADQSMPSGGSVCIRLDNRTLSESDCNSLPNLQPGKYVCISIRDKGEGISPENLPRIFDPYYTTRQEGSGLGLTTAYSIVRKHGGDIQVRSELGKGSEFFIYLPVSSAEQAGIEQPTEPEDSRRSGRILVMDDEEVIRSVAADMLEYLGYGAVLASDGSEALDLYRKALTESKPFDAVIMDLTVPGGMGGGETIGKLLEIDPHVNAIVSSGYSNDPIMASYREYGFRGIIKKPYQIHELGEALKDVVSAG